MRIPIACTLSAEGVVDRVDEWRAFLAQSVEAAERPASGRLRFRLEGSEGTLVAAADLAQREKECCSFFEFSIDVHAEALWLDVRVPDDAAGILSDFAGLLPTNLRP